MASYSVDLRERIVKAHLEEGQTKSAVARRFGVGIDDHSTSPVHAHLQAYAEINALLAFPFGARSASCCTLLTTTEPCPLCVGAVRMSGVGGLTYASRDPWAGSAALFETVPYIRQKETWVASLAGSRLETCLIALQVDAHLRLSRPEGEHLLFFDAWREIVPTGVAAGEKLFGTDVLLALARTGADVQSTVEIIERVVKAVS